MEYPETLAEFFKKLFASSDFMPHGHCYLWRADIVWLHAIPDAITALAYYSIPCALVYFVLKRKDLVFSWIFVMFGIFILACGTTHIMDVITLWKPVYRLDALIRLFTAAVSILTAAILWPLIPKALLIPSPTQLKQINEKLTIEVGQRRTAEESLHAIQKDLEKRVKERTAELLLLNEKLKVEIDQRQLVEETLRVEKKGLAEINELMTGREERILELKSEINALLKQAGQTEKYNIPGK